MTTVPDRKTFESAYAGQAPWDISRPQKAFIDVADQITGSVLDAGCGTGENALDIAGLRIIRGWPIRRWCRFALDRDMSVCVTT
jgi:hypothetical protein